MRSRGRPRRRGSTSLLASFAPRPGRRQPGPRLRASELEQRRSRVGPLTGCRSRPLRGSLPARRRHRAAIRRAVRTARRLHASRERPRGEGSEGALSDLAVELDPGRQPYSRRRAPSGPGKVQDARRLRGAGCLQALLAARPGRDGCQPPGCVLPHHWRQCDPANRQRGAEPGYPADHGPGNLHLPRSLPAGGRACTDAANRAGRGHERGRGHRDRLLGGDRGERALPLRGRGLRSGSRRSRGGRSARLAAPYGERENAEGDDERSQANSPS